MYCIVTGTTETEFEPEESSISRAEFTAMLVRTLRLTQEVKPLPFSDIARFSWYAEPIAAAYEEPLTNDAAKMSQVILAYGFAVFALKKWKMGKSN